MPFAKTNSWIIQKVLKNINYIDKLDFMKNLLLLLLLVPVVSFGQKSSQRFNPLSGEYEPWVYFVIYVILPLWFFFAIYLNLPSKKEKKRKKDLGEFKNSIKVFIEKMKEIPDWYQIIQARGNGHAMMVNAGIKADNYEYWGNAHKDEYIMKYKESNLDVEGIKLRIEKFRLITTELEKVIKIASKLNLNVTTEMANDYHAARASVLGAEKALKEMTS